MFHKKIFILYLIFAVFLIIIAGLSTVNYKAKVIVKNKLYIVEVANTTYFLEKGLSGHPPLKNDEGMFFVFQKPDKYGFWMKDMLFPIDIIWIDKDFKIIHIEKSVSPGTYPKVFYPEADSLYVLEVSADEAEKLNLKAGDAIQFLQKIDRKSP